LFFTLFFHGVTHQKNASDFGMRFAVSLSTDCAVILAILTLNRLHK